MATTALVGGTVIDGTGRDPIHNAVVLVIDDRIVNVFREGEFDVAEGVRVIDVSGKTLIPGLIDCHVHVGNLADNAFYELSDSMAGFDQCMRAFMERGVTTIRDTGNYDPKLTEGFKQGNPGWPRFFGAGPILDGVADDATPWKWVRTVGDVATAREEVARLIDEGSDFLKVYVWTTAPVLQAIVDEAHARGTRVTAHVGHILTVEQAVRIGVDSLEHVRVGPELVSDDDREAYEGLRARAWDPLVSWMAWRYADPTSERANRLIELMKERGVIMTPTLTLSQSILKGDEPEMSSPPGLERVPEVIRKGWEAGAVSFDYTEEDFRQGRTELARHMNFVGLARKAGLKITAGTDTMMPYVVPGNSLHEELRLLVEAGLSPMEAIVAGTSAAAELLGQQTNIGSIEKGKFADLLVLDADPLEEIQNTRRIALVMKAGQGQVVPGPSASR